MLNFKPVAQPGSWGLFPKVLKWSEKHKFLVIILEDDLGTIERAICECDFEFVSTVDVPNVSFQDFNTQQCVPFSNMGRSSAVGACCLAPTGMYSWYVL